MATNVAVSCNPFFERDATDLLRWMRHALENLHMDTLVVTSAATLALRYARLHAPEGLARRRPNNLSSTNKSKRRKPGEKGRPEGRRKQGVTAYLLSFTTLHLASKYHEVYEKQLEDLGITVAPTKIYKLGESDLADIQSRVALAAHISKRRFDVDVPRLVEAESVTYSSKI